MENAVFKLEISYNELIPSYAGFLSICGISSCLSLVVKGNLCSKLQICCLEFLIIFKDEADV